MENGIHFISGLPRSGSTLLASLLRQNPRFHAAMTSPVSNVFMAAQASMSGRNEFHVFLDDSQRMAILRGIFEGFYGGIHQQKTIFDTNRTWCSKLGPLSQLFPQAKVICCVRNLAWIIDSFERLIRRNAFQLSRIFNFEPGGNVYTRAEALTKDGGVVRIAIDGLRDAFYSELSSRLMLVTYESLARRPAKTLDAIYDFIDAKPFAHDFEHVEYDADEYDERMGTPGLHRVASRVEFVERPTILPPDLFAKFQHSAFWLDPAVNPANVRIV
jgi:sulfotransferase